MHVAVARRGHGVPVEYFGARAWSFSESLFSESLLNPSADFSDCEGFTLRIFKKFFFCSSPVALPLLMGGSLETR